MAAELRWILLASSLVLLAGIWWWGRRRSTQAPGNAALREITPTAEPVRHEPPAAEALSNVETEPDAQAREWGVPPFEPLSIHTQEYDHVPILDGPMMVDADLAPALSAAGASATRAMRYSTLTTFQPISSHGMMDMNDASLVPPIQPPP